MTGVYYPDPSTSLMLMPLVSKLTCEAKQCNGKKTLSLVRSSKQLYLLVVIPHRAHSSKLSASASTPSKPIPQQKRVFNLSSIWLKLLCIVRTSLCFKCTTPNIAVHVKKIPLKYIFLYYSTDFTTDDCVKMLFFYCFRSSVYL